MKEGRNDSWIRGQQTCPLTTYINIWTVSSDVSIQRRQRQPLSVQPKMWMMCEGWPHHRGLRPLLFSKSGVGSFTNHKNQISASAVRRDPRLFPRGGGGSSAPRSNPLPFYIPFLAKKVALSYTFYWQMVPLSHTSFRTLQPFQLL